MNIFPIRDMDEELEAELHSILLNLDNLESSNWNRNLIDPRVVSLTSNEVNQLKTIVIFSEYNPSFSTIASNALKLLMSLSEDFSLKRLNLPGITLSDSAYRKSEVYKSDLSFANIHNLNFLSANFNATNLIRADFTGDIKIWYPNKANFCMFSRYGNSMIMGTSSSGLNVWFKNSHTIQSVFSDQPVLLKYILDESLPIEVIRYQILFQHQFPDVDTREIYHMQKIQFSVKQDNIALFVYENGHLGLYRYINNSLEVAHVSVFAHSNMIDRAFILDISSFITSSLDGTIKFWKFQEALTYHTIEDYKNSLDLYERRIVYVNKENKIIIFDILDLCILNEVICESLFISAVAFSKSGHLLYAIIYEDFIAIRHSMKLKRKIKKKEIRSVLFSPSREYIVSCGSEEKVNIWNVRTGRLHISLKHYASVNCLCFLTDKLLFTGSDDSSVKKFSIDQENCLMSSSYEFPLTGIYQIHPEFFLSIDTNETAYIFHYDTMEKYKKIHWPLKQFAISHEMNSLIYKGSDCILMSKLTDLFEISRISALEHVKQIPMDKIPRSRITMFAISASEQLIGLSYENGQVCIFDQYKQILTFKLKFRIEDMKIGTYIIVSTSAEIQVWSVTGLIQSFANQFTRLQAIDYSSELGLIAIGTQYGELRLFDLYVIPEIPI